MTGARTTIISKNLSSNKYLPLVFMFMTGLCQACGSPGTTPVELIQALVPVTTDAATATDTTETEQSWEQALPDTAPDEELLPAPQPALLPSETEESGPPALNPKSEGTASTINNPKKPNPYRFQMDGTVFFTTGSGSNNFYTITSGDIRPVISLVDHPEILAAGNIDIPWVKSFFTTVDGNVLIQTPMQKSAGHNSLMTCSIFKSTKDEPMMECLDDPYGKDVSLKDRFQIDADNRIYEKLRDPLSWALHEDFSADILHVTATSPGIQEVTKWLTHANGTIYFTARTTSGFLEWMSLYAFDPFTMTVTAVSNPWSQIEDFIFLDATHILLRGRAARENSTGNELPGNVILDISEETPEPVKLSFKGGCLASLALSDEGQVYILKNQKIYRIYPGNPKAMNIPLRHIEKFNIHENHIFAMGYQGDQRVLWQQSLDDPQNFSRNPLADFSPEHFVFDGMDFYFSGFDRQSKVHVIGRLDATQVFDLSLLPEITLLGEVNDGIRDMQSVTDWPNLSFSDMSLDKPRHASIKIKAPKNKTKPPQP